MGIDPVSLSIASLALAGIGTAAQTVGSIQSANASSAAAKYNAQVAEQNAQVAQQNATWAVHAGEAQAEQAGQKTRAEAGAIKAAQAANNVEVNSGSAVDVRSSAAELGELSAINIRSNAARTAYGYQTQATSEEAKSQLDQYQASQDKIAGEVGAGSTLLGGLGSATSNYAKFLQNSSPINAGSIGTAAGNYYDSHAGN